MDGERGIFMQNILVICTGNTCRSPMAAGIIRQIAKEKGIAEGLSVQSMGLAAFDGDGASDYAIAVLEEIGIDIRGHRSRSVLLQDLLDADRIYVMTGQHRDVILDAAPEVEGKIVVMDVPDPFGQSIDRYRECRDRMLGFFKRELGKLGSPEGNV